MPALCMSATGARGSMRTMQQHCLHQGSVPPPFDWNTQAWSLAKRSYMLRSLAGVEGQPSNTTVYTIVNNNANEFGPFVCIDACAHGNTCIWQNAWLWQCNGTNPTHHYWVWEPDTKVIRSATTDSFEQNPEICLDMCTDTRYGNGACVVTTNSSVLNVGYRECTGASNQVRRRYPHSIPFSGPPADL